MYEEDVTTSQASNENEIEINLQETNNETNAVDDTKTATLTTEPKKQAFKSVDPKNVGELTDDERAIIIANAKNGIDQPNFDVRFFRNGKFRIVRKKEKPPTISEKVVKTQEIPQNVKKAYYTDNQLLFEHIIELNAKVDRLMNKHKKLKRKYQALQSDIYVDDDELETVNAQTLGENAVNASHFVADIKDEPSNAPVNEQPVIEPPQSPIVQSIQQMQTSTPTPTRRNWRSQLRYL